MNDQLNKPKGFGEILDITFRISKSRFKEFFTILLILVGPVYLLQAFIQLATGTSFLREVGTGDGWFEQMLSSFEGAEPTFSSNVAADLGIAAVSLISFVTYPIAIAAILFGVNHLRKQEEFTVGSLIRKGFSRFWAILGCNILFVIIMILLILAATFFVVFSGFLTIAFEPVIGIIFTILLVLVATVTVLYLLTRWGFYFGSVVIEKDTPGIARSWTLTKGRAWFSLGLYIIFFLIISSISAAMELSFGLILGGSVLLGLIVNITTLFTMLIMTVGYSVMYLDLKIRHDADDLKDMINQYNAK
ncbi:hypothetical protein [Sutcliffiella deserti]|uniref:hypothetical protein n=1 Tax=Sutcliffiella deserti TaxID=2875501 RepID=UPI001CBECBF4|nr:hypothetical protein [Sutcliffiella deserti]